LSKRKAVIFDLDDTLYPESSYVQSGFQAVASWIHDEAIVETPPESIARQLWDLQQQNPGRAFDLWLSENEIHDTSVTQMIAIYRSHDPAISPFPEIAGVLGQLRESGFLLGVITDGYLEVQKRKWGVLQLGHHFKSVVFSDSFGRDNWKPHSRPYQVSLQQLGVPALHAVYIGDNPAKDFLGARRCGLRSVRFRSPGGVYSAFETADAQSAPDDEVQQLNQVPDCVSRLIAEDA